MNNFANIFSIRMICRSFTYDEKLIPRCLLDLLNSNKLKGYSSKILAKRLKEPDESGIKKDKHTMKSLQW